MPFAVDLYNSFKSPPWNGERAGSGLLPPTAVAVEKAEERLAKFSVHETVRDGIAAARDVSQQLHQANAGAADDRVHQVGSEEVPRIDHMQRCPAHEKLKDYHEEHSDHLEHSSDSGV